MVDQSMKIIRIAKILNMPNFDPDNLPPWFDRATEHRWSVLDDGQRVQLINRARLVMMEINKE